MSETSGSSSAGLQQLGRLWLPRLLTQVCRDPGSPCFGCFDRDWWHYRIRDFPSVILQQGGYALHLAAQLAANQGSRPGLREVAAAACRFWNERAVRKGAFEEYYPWEQGYPPLAFSTLAVLKMAAAGVLPAEEIRQGAAVACRQLQARFESQAANQQVAGLAALAWGKRLFPEAVEPARFADLSARTLALQRAEGWFEEYGGPDLGYLSVTLDCLWDLFDATQDRRFIEAIRLAVAWMDLFTSVLPGGSIGMHNARNTDYLLPYGLMRAALELDAAGRPAARLCAALFQDVSPAGHFLHAIDDRYLTHYTGQSVFRALGLLEQAGADGLSKIFGSGFPAARVDRVTASGHVLRQRGPGEGLLITLRKGAIFTWCTPAGRVSDFGWVVRQDGREFITHWWSQDWIQRVAENRWEVEGRLYEHQEVTSTPGRHLALRCMSWLLGRRLISRLKRRLIFDKRPGAIPYRRTLEWEEGSLRVTDSFPGLSPRARLIPAPRSSKRHVASADSFHEEDFHAVRGFDLKRQITRREPLGAEVVTVYEKHSEQP